MCECEFVSVSVRACVGTCANKLDYGHIYYSVAEATVIEVPLEGQVKSDLATSL